MQKTDFLQELQKRAQEQQKLRQEIPFPKVFQFVSLHLGNHPWRPLIPISVVISFLLYAFFGKTYIEFVLWIFKIL